MWSVKLWNLLLCRRLSVFMFVSVWEGSYSWLCEVTGRHGSKLCLAVREGRCVAGVAYGWTGCCRPGKVKLLVGMKSEQRMWGKREPLEERKRMGASSEVRIVMQVFQVAM